MARKPHKHQPTPKAFETAYKYSKVRDAYYGDDNATIALRNAYNLACLHMPKGEQDDNATLAHIMMTLLAAEAAQVKAASDHGWGKSQAELRAIRAAA